MPRVCSVCSHNSASAITKEIADGVSFRAIASHFDVTFHAVARHSQNCLHLRRKEQKSATVPERGDRDSLSRIDPHDPQTLISTTARLVDEALDLLEHAKKADDHRTALVALREARDGLALLMRTAGMLTADGGTIIDARRQTVQLFGKLTESELRALAAAPGQNSEAGRC
jgi:hypothetical protein